MINLSKIDIKSVGDYDQLLNIINPLYIKKNIAEELKSRVGANCKSIIVEYPYRDIDFSSTYSAFHSKKHKFIPKECYRLHFFSEESLSNDSYCGFLVLRPSYVENRGRAHINPKMLINSRKYLMLASAKAHILGDEFDIPSFPWMSQETDIAVCAHSAVWSVLRYFSLKFNRYYEHTMNDIVRLTPQYIARKTPSEGLNILQIAETFSNTGSHPLLLHKRSDTSKFIGSIFAYIESGIPIVGCMTNKEHAVSIIGHGNLDYALLDSLSEDYISSHELINSLVISDDNHLPYSEVTKSAGTVTYTFDDLDYAIVPLYEKMFLSADIVRERVMALLKTGNLDIKLPLVLRTYMTSSKSLKEKVRSDLNIERKLVQILLRLPMPKFVWCVDLSSKEEFKSGMMSGKIIIDITAGTFEKDPWILMHDSTKIKFFDSMTDKIMVETVNLKPYTIFQNNLKEA